MRQRLRRRESRKYPAFYEVIVPAAIGLITLGVIALLIIIAAFAAGLSL